MVQYWESYDRGALEYDNSFYIRALSYFQGHENSLEYALIRFR